MDIQPLSIKQHLSMVKTFSAVFNTTKPFRAEHTTSIEMCHLDCVCLLSCFSTDGTVPVGLKLRPRCWCVYMAPIALLVLPHSELLLQISSLLIKGLFSCKVSLYRQICGLLSPLGL